MSDKKWSFSKAIFAAILIMTSLVVIYSCIMMGVLADLSPLDTLITSVFAECAVVSGFYAYKAKAENEIKLDIERRKLFHQYDQENGTIDEFMEDN